MQRASLSMPYNTNDKRYSIHHYLPVHIPVHTPTRMNDIISPARKSKSTVPGESRTLSIYTNTQPINTEQHKLDPNAMTL